MNRTEALKKVSEWFTGDTKYWSNFGQGSIYEFQEFNQGVMILSLVWGGKLYILRIFEIGENIHISVDYEKDAATLPDMKLDRRIEL